MTAAVELLVVLVVVVVAAAVVGLVVVGVGVWSVATAIRRGTARRRRPGTVRMGSMARSVTEAPPPNDHLLPPYMRTIPVEPPDDGTSTG